VALIVGGILAALAIVAVVAFVVLVDRVDEELDEVGTRTVDGVETNSGNEQNPPPRDVELERCFTDDVGDVAAEGTAKNNTSETSSYTIEVTFHAGGRRIAGGNAFLAGVEPGETATWQASDPTDAPAEFDCRVQVVNRFASS
jgi:hypothetical protein